MISPGRSIASDRHEETNAFSLFARGSNKGEEGDAGEGDRREGGEGRQTTWEEMNKWMNEPGSRRAIKY